MTRRDKRRIIGVCTALLMLLTVFPATGFAADVSSPVDTAVASDLQLAEDAEDMSDPADTAVTSDAQTAASVNKVSKIEVSKKKLAVDVGFYTSGAPGGKLSEKQIRKQLKAVKKFANTVRFYGAAGELTKAYPIAKKMNFKVIGTAWLSKDTAANKKELNALIKCCNKGYVSVACVGSETQIRGDLSQKKLISYMKYVRKHLKKKVPVTTADDADTLLGCPDVCRACDLLMVNAYPYWGGVEVSEAEPAFAKTIDRVREAYPQKEIIVSETGWPTAGGTCGDAKAGGSQARRYFSDIRAWSLETGIPVLWFDAADEPWKAASEGKAGAHWGLMTKNCKLKKCYKKAPFFRGR